MKIKIIYVTKEKLYPAGGYSQFKTEKIFIRKDLPKLIQKFLIEHERFHIIDYKRLKGKKETLFWCELKAYLYAFFKQPLGGLFGIIRNLYPPQFISFIKFYFNNNKKQLRKIEHNLKC